VSSRTVAVLASVAALLVGRRFLHHIHLEAS
jgi:hypothetical protein